MVPEQIGRYRISSVLGQGAMGVVYRAFDPALEREIALKTIRLDASPDPEVIERFYREAKSAARLAHPNIVTIYDCGQADGIAYIGMELLNGPSLKQVLQEETLPTRRALAYTGQIAAGLSYAHLYQVVHRDIKPANMVCLPNGVLKITDFGIAQIPVGDLTQAGTLVGSPKYMSPEQIRGGRVDGRSDLFSLGVMLYEMLTRRHPFDGDSLSAIMYKIIQEDPIDPLLLNPTLTQEVQDIVLRLLAKSPQQRYQSADEVIPDLKRAIKPSLAAPGSGASQRAPQGAEATAGRGAGEGAAAAQNEPGSRGPDPAQAAQQIVTSKPSSALGGGSGGSLADELSAPGREPELQAAAPTEVAASRPAHSDVDATLVAQPPEPKPVVVAPATRPRYALWTVLGLLLCGSVAVVAWQVASSLAVPAVAVADKNATPSERSVSPQTDGQALSAAMGVVTPLPTRVTVLPPPETPAAVPAPGLPPAGLTPSGAIPNSSTPTGTVAASPPGTDTRLPRPSRTPGAGESVAERPARVDPPARKSFWERQRECEANGTCKQQIPTHLP